MSIEAIKAALVGVPNTRTEHEYLHASDKPVVCTMGDRAIVTDVRYSTTKEAWAKYYAAAHPVAIKDLIHDLEAARERVEALEKRLEIGPHGEDQIDVIQSAYAQLEKRLDTCEDALKRLKEDLQPACTTASRLPSHTDNTGVELLAAAMKNKLRICRLRGKGGWDKPSMCSVEWLVDLLHQELRKGAKMDPVDVANFAMMIYNRQQSGE